ncbi:hypothetical protein ABZ907_12815 [Nonomuraea wenchangensis]
MSRIEQVTAAAYRVPTDRPEGDGTLAWDALAIPAIWDALVRQVRNAGRPGLAGYAVSALDVALWDLKARLLGTSLAGLFGPARERVPLYGHADRRPGRQGRLRRLAVPAPLRLSACFAALLADPRAGRWLLAPAGGGPTTGCGRRAGRSSPASVSCPRMTRACRGPWTRSGAS